MRTPHYGELGAAGSPPHYRIWCSRLDEPEFVEPLVPPSHYCCEDGLKELSSRQFMAWICQFTTLREHAILRLRFEHDMTLDEVGTIYGVTRERIRQIEQKVFRTLRYRIGLQERDRKARNAGFKDAMEMIESGLFV